MAYTLYPAVDESYAFPPEVRAKLATSVELRNTVVPMTTTLRNNLAGAELWDGRLILNTTTNLLNFYDADNLQWLEVANTAAIAAAVTTAIKVSTSPASGTPATGEVLWVQI